MVTSVKTTTDGDERRNRVPFSAFLVCHEAFRYWLYIASDAVKVKVGVIAHRRRLSFTARLLRYQETSNAENGCVEAP